MFCKPFPRNKRSKSKKQNREISNFEEQVEENVEHHALFRELRAKALEVSTEEPFTKPLLERTILHPQVQNFNSAISRSIATRLISSCGSDPILCSEQMTKIFESAMKSSCAEYGKSMAEAVYEDILACKRRDPACKSELEVVLFYKGFASLVCHRAARRHYGLSCTTDGNIKSSRYVSLWLQSQASAAFGVDIHPAGVYLLFFHCLFCVCVLTFSLTACENHLAEIGSGVFFDHATGLVIGETAVVGNDCTILHGVTLGGTGKVSGDRHPKVNWLLISYSFIYYYFNLVVCIFILNQYLFT